ncbi:MAG: hypothetical protein K2P81_16745 [Bacteriovoracaceae bacterium]|nr:hypothetical protein [Bacteriovoracaceae bacterium]
MHFIFANIFAGEMSWLESQSKSFHTNSQLIQSYTDREQTFVYDQALAIIAFTKAGKFSTAKKLAYGLEQIQNNDGSWYFSYYPDGKSPHPTEGDMRPNGAIAWAVLSLLQYQRATNDRSFSKTWRKSLAYLEANIVNIGEENLKAVRFSSVDYKKTPWDETQVAALEHNLNSIAVFKLAFQMTKQKKWHKRQLELEKFALSLWDESVEHFWSGRNIQTGKINRSEFYLDNQSWSALALHHLKENKKIVSSLKSSCRLEVKSKSGSGFSESRSPASIQEFIWSEGTAGKALALKLNNTQCDDTHPDHYQETLEKMKVSGGVKYVDRENVNSFAHAPSVAGTVWTWFLKHQINPFDV